MESRLPTPCPSQTAAPRDSATWGRTRAAPHSRTQPHVGTLDELLHNSQNTTASSPAALFSVHHLEL
jgi:hypothetical protein